MRSNCLRGFGILPNRCRTGVGLAPIGRPSDAHRSPMAPPSEKDARRSTRAVCALPLVTIYRAPEAHKTHRKSGCSMHHPRIALGPDAAFGRLFVSTP